MFILLVVNLDVLKSYEPDAVVSICGYLLISLSDMVNRFDCNLPPFH